LDDPKNSSKPLPISFTSRTNGLAIAINPAPSTSLFHTQGPNTTLRSNINTLIDSHMNIVDPDIMPTTDGQPGLFQHSPLQLPSPGLSHHVSNNLSPPLPATTKKKSRKKKEENEEHDNQILDFTQLHKIMEEHILKDDGLYSKILRYEVCLSCLNTVGLLLIDYNLIAHPL
jgi:hypothetical protein